MTTTMTARYTVLRHRTPSHPPLPVEVPQADLDDLRQRIAATRWPNEKPSTDRVAGRAARDDAGARALLGDGVRLAQGRGED